MALTGTELAQIQKALLDAYPSTDLLRQMVRIEMDEYLDAIAGGTNLAVLLFNLITWADAHNKVELLIQAALRDNPENLALKTLAVTFGRPRLPSANSIVGQPGNRFTPVGQDLTANADNLLLAHAEPQSHSDELYVKALRERALVPFVGAGLSMGAGLPSWYELIGELAMHTGHQMPERQWASGDMLIDMAQDYINRHGTHALVSYLKDRLDTTSLRPTTAHEALAQLPVNIIFTSNYDDLLERAFRTQGKHVEVLTRDTHIPFMRQGTNSVNIVKLFGDLNQPDTLVLAREQYERFFIERPRLVSLLEAELGRSSFLYLGWSHSDPHFRLVFGEALARYGPYMRNGFAAMLEVSDAQKRELSRKQIQLLELPVGPDMTTRLAVWLQDLGVASSKL